MSERARNDEWSGAAHGAPSRTGVALGALDRLVGATAAAAAACVGVALLWAPQERLVFQPPRVRRRDRAVPDGAERVDYAAADGQPLHGFVVRPPRAAARAGAVLAFHGNAELAEWSVPWAREVARRTGRAVFLPEYRGYAGLPGAPTYEGSRLDAAAAHRTALAMLDVAASELVLFGHSLGSAVAAELATAGGAPRALVLQSPFSSARAMARMSAAPLRRAWARIARIHFDTAARVAELDAPVSVAHGRLDLIVPSSMGRLVHASARRPGDLLVVPTAGHNDVARRGGERYWSWLDRAAGSE